MDNLSKILNSHPITLNIGATTAAIAQNISGLFLCKNIYENKSTYDVSSMPFVGGLITAILMLKYALLINNFTLLAVYTVSTIMQTIYLFIYNHYTDDRVNEVYKPLSYGFAATTALYGYASLGNPRVVEQRYGTIATLIVLFLLRSPISQLQQVIEEKDASQIPPASKIFESMSSMFWIFYGIALKNKFLLVQHIISLLLGAVQLALYLKYPKGSLEA